eukprot:scaffold122301_cov66-Phaeocystis_antarctica.AAC.2
MPMWAEARGRETRRCSVPLCTKSGHSKVDQCARGKSHGKSTSKQPNTPLPTTRHAHPTAHPTAHLSVLSGRPHTDPDAGRAARRARGTHGATPAVGLGLGPLGPTHATRDLERRERTTKVVATRAVNPGTTCPLIRLARSRGDGRARDRGRARGRSRRLDARGRAGLSVPVACPRHRVSSPGLVRRLPPQHLPHFTFISTQPQCGTARHADSRRRSIETPGCRESAP